MTVGPIPFSSIDRFADRFGFTDPDDYELLRRSLRAMDEVYLTHVRKQAEKNKPPPT